MGARLEDRPDRLELGICWHPEAPTEWVGVRLRGSHARRQALVIALRIRAQATEGCVLEALPPGPMPTNLRCETQLSGVAVDFGSARRTLTDEQALSAAYSGVALIMVGFVATVVAMGIGVDAALPVGATLLGGLVLLGHVAKTYLTTRYMMYIGPGGLRITLPTGQTFDAVWSSVVGMYVVDEGDGPEIELILSPTVGGPVHPLHNMVQVRVGHGQSVDALKWLCATSLSARAMVAPAPAPQRRFHMFHALRRPDLSTSVLLGWVVIALVFCVAVADPSRSISEWTAQAVIMAFGSGLMALTLVLWRAARRRYRTRIVTTMGGLQIDRKHIPWRVVESIDALGVVVRWGQHHTRRVSTVRLRPEQVAGLRECWERRRTSPEPQEPQESAAFRPLMPAESCVEFDRHVIELASEFGNPRAPWRLRRPRALSSFIPLMSILLYPASCALVFWVVEESAFTEVHFLASMWTVTTAAWLIGVAVLWAPLLRPKKSRIVLHATGIEVKHATLPRAINIPWHALLSVRTNQLADDLVFEVLFDPSMVDEGAIMQDDLGRGRLCLGGGAPRLTLRWLEHEINSRMQYVVQPSSAQDTAKSTRDLRQLQAMQYKANFVR